VSGAHSFLPPSGASAWSRCALWPSMNLQFPQDDSPETIEGTAAHWVVAEMLAGRTVTEGKISPAGVSISGEMLDGAELVCETVARMLPAAQLHIEETVSIPAIHPDCFGTPDIWAYCIGTLDIIDYKFGHGFVDEYFNLQGLTYALGVLEKYDLNDPAIYERIKVRFTVVQPRCFYRGEPVRTHTYTMREAAEYIEALKAAALMAMQPQPLAITGEQCSHCPGRHACSTLQRAAYSDAEFADNRQPHTLSPQAAALELRMLERALSRLEARVDGLRELTLANIKAGANIPYYRAESGKGRVQWTAEPEQIITIGQMLGKDLSKPGVVTPLQAKKYIDESVISAYSSIIPGAIKLVPANNSDARRVFENNPHK
jgi:hypothetical protein